METQPDITVLMPVYNAEKYLREAISSILQQTFTRFELLVIDDGSADASVQIIRSFHDPRIRFVQNEKNMGISATLNKGIGLSRTELIARMDADDISYPDRLEKQYAFFLQHPDCALLSTWARMVDKNKNPVKTERWRSAYYYYNLNFECWIYHPTVMYKRSAVMDVGMYSTVYAEDHNLWWQLSRKYRMYNLPEVLVDYRLTDESLCRVTKKTEYDTAQHEQVLRNILYYTGPHFHLTYNEARCLMYDFEPVLQENSIRSVIRCFQHLHRITRAILEKENVNRDKTAIAEAAYYKREWMLTFFCEHLSPARRIYLLLALGYWKKTYALLKGLYRKKQPAF